MWIDIEQERGERIAFRPGLLADGNELMWEILFLLYTFNGLLMNREGLILTLAKKEQAIQSSVMPFRIQVKRNPKAARPS
jgi:hypothetical protein